MSVFRRAPGRPGKHEAAAPTKRIGVLVPLGLLEQLVGIAKTRGITRHAAIREAIADYVDKHRPETKARE